MFKCNCGGEFRVTNTINMESNIIYRRRTCSKCKKVIFTAEKETNDKLIMTTTNKFVIKKGE